MVKNKKGKVFLVGAGPGDAGLLTIKAARCLGKADVVVYDYHLNSQVLGYVRSDAEFIYAGKRGGHHTMSQDDINATLIDRARDGKTVCRLKGGDPFVFGRGGEEACALVDAGLEFEIVPGVSSSVAAPAYAGIPLTHRKISSSFAVIPGYEDATKQGSSIDWQKIATGVGTLVFLMAVKNVGELVQKLIENGKPPETPVAVIRWGTRPEQRTITSTLAEIAGRMKQTEIKPPAVMVVGEVVRLREKLKWYETKPLFGHRVLVTREHSTPGFASLEDLGAEIVEFPAIEIVPPASWQPLDEALGNAGSYDWIIFTSTNGVKFFFKRFRELRMDIRSIRARICAVGSKTAEAVRRFCLNVDLVPEEFRAEGLIDAFTGLYPSGRLDGVRFLLPRAEEAREIFPEQIRRMGGVMDVPAAYRAVKPLARGKRLKRFLKEGKITVATFTSAATFTNFMEILGADAGSLLQGVSIAAIGPVTAKKIEQAGLKTRIMPAKATMEALAEAIRLWALGEGDAGTP
ncbi:MAG: uroporphyrinogen-III C-methyltransferase [Nitrospiraceae bacterium]|nr:uroporphyrinogen-III C-methyltransferase [Nitrospiraceae bacterium]